MPGSLPPSARAYDLPAERWRRCAAGLGVFVVATLLRLALQPLLGDQAPFLIHVAGVAIATWIGGVEGGVCAVLAGSVAVDYLFVSPAYTFKQGDVDHLAGMSLFVIVTFALVWQVGRWRRAEQSLRESDEDLNRAQGVAHTGSWRLDVRRNELRWSDETYRIFGVAAGTPMTYETFLDAVHPEDRDRVSQAWQVALAGSVYDIDHRIVVGGVTRWVNERAELDVDGRGRLRGGFGTVQDITSRKETEGVLQRYDLLAQHSRDIMLVIRRPDGRILEANHAAAEAYGYSREELRNLTIHDLRAPEGSPLTAAQMEAADASGILFESTHVRRDGTTFPVEVSSRGATIGGERLLLSVARDVTRRKEAEQALRETERRLTALMNATTESIWLLNRDGAVVAANATAALRLGMTVEGTIGRLWWQLVQPKVGAPRLRHFDDVVATGQPSRFEDERADLVFDHNFYPVRQPDGAVSAVAVFSQDITEQKRAAEERERLYRQAEEANRIKDDFLATLSHELRTPLNAILGWSHMLAAGTLTTAMQRQAVDVILRNAQAQTRLVEEVIDLSRIVSGKFHLDLQLVDARSFTERALETVAVAARAKQLTIDSRLPDDVRMVGDPDRLQQVMWNLLSNAVKFTPKGGRIEVSASREHSHVELRVSDTGIGVVPEFLPHLFERFTQAESSRSRRYGGIGLGLAIVRHVVELHGGTVRALSAGEGLGATFTVLFPITAVVPEAVAKAPGAGATLAQQDSFAASLVGVRVLAVDDDADSLQVLQTILVGHGATVMVAGSAGAGMDTLRRFRPDVLISDIGMPGVDGYGFIRHVRALSPDEGGRIPAVALTAYGQAGDRREALNAGYDEHMAKPVTPQNLVRTVAAIMRPMTPSTGG